jgi:hypothetical protein
MKVTKTSVHRLTIEKTCGCQATREYEDVRYTKPVAEGVFTACEKHEKNKLIAEFAGEMLIEALDKEAETAGKTVVASVRETATALSGTSGGSVTSMGAPNVPKSREKVDPLKPKTAHFDRPDPRRPSNTSPTGNLNLAQHEDISDEELQEQGITMTGDIDGVPVDPRVDQALGEGLRDLENIFDDEDAKAGGVSQKLINIQAVD